MLSQGVRKRVFGKDVQSYRQVLVEFNHILSSSTGTEPFFYFQNIHLLRPSNFSFAAGGHWWFTMDLRKSTGRPHCGHSNVSWQP